MKLRGNSRGFSLIELLVTISVIAILAGIAITAYIGILDKSRRATMIRSASSALPELELWLHASLTGKRDVVEVDTNLDGRLNNMDRTNSQLLTDGVVNVYLSARNSTPPVESSPWFSRPLWNSDDEPLNGTINLRQPQSNYIEIKVIDKNGDVIFERKLFI